MIAIEQTINAAGALVGAIPCGCPAPTVIYISRSRIMKRVVSNMAGVVLEYLVQPGDTIAVDQDVVMLESMKMQIPVQSTVSGTVKELKANEGDFVDDGDVLIEVE